MNKSYASSLRQSGQRGSQKDRTTHYNKNDARVTKAASIIIKYLARFLAKISARRYRCEKLFENAVQALDGPAIINAYNRTKFYGVASKAISSYIDRSQDLVGTMMTEAHVADRLQDAVRSGNEDLLKSAIQLAESSSACNILLLGEARLALEELRRTKLDLSNMQHLLDSCTSIAKLVSSYDSIQDKIENALLAGKGNDSLVKTALYRLARLKNVIEVRDRMRAAVLLCSAAAMKAAMEARKPYTKLYGADVLQEEADSINGLTKMFAYESQIQRQFRTQTLYGEDSLLDDGGVSRRASVLFASQEADAPVDSLLPIFVRVQLEKMSDASSYAEYEANHNTFISMIPQENRRKAYVRLFKWVVANAAWRYKSKLLSEHSQSEGQSDSRAGLKKSTKEVYDHNYLSSSSITSAPLRSEAVGRQIVREARVASQADKAQHARKIADRKIESAMRAYDESFTFFSADYDMLG